jgi:hypothetical protein
MLKRSIGTEFFLLHTKRNDSFIANVSIFFRFDASLESTLRVYESIFSRRFWENVILVFSHADLESVFDSDDEPHPGETYANNIATAFNLPHPIPYCYASVGRNRGRRLAADTRTLDDMRKQTQADYMDTLLELIQSHEQVPYTPTHFHDYVQIHGGMPLDYTASVVLPRAQQVERLFYLHVYCILIPTLTNNEVPHYPIYLIILDQTESPP